MGIGGIQFSNSIKLLSHLYMQNSQSFVSLYSGCGGLDLGFIQAGYKCAHAYDIDKTAIDVHRQNIESQATVADLSEINQSVVRTIERADILLAGPPCQGFSTAGKNNPHDKRNGHLKNVAVLASLARPKVVLIENVKGLLSRQNSDHLQSTLSTFASAGYQVTWALHNTADYGVAQSRVRVLIFAVLSQNKFNLTPELSSRLTLREALSGLGNTNLPNFSVISHGSDEEKIAERIRPGQKFSNVRSGVKNVHSWDIPEVYGKVSKEEVMLLEAVLKLRRRHRRRENGDADPVEREVLDNLLQHNSSQLVEGLVEKGYLRKLGSYIDLANTFNGKYRRLEWDDVAPTVDTRFGQPRYFLHPGENRGFTISEAARIQSFPDNFRFSGSETAIYRMIGNAVPPKFARAVAMNIAQVWGEM